MSILRIVVIASNARLAAALSGLLLARSSARGVICQEKPQRSLHQPHSLSCPPLPTMAFHITVGLFLVVGQDHEADRLIGLKIGSAVQADERPAEHGELDREFGALRSTRKV